MKKIVTKLGIFILTAVLAVLLSLPVMAEGHFDGVTIENGKLVGLNTNYAYEYAYVTLENYNNGLSVTEADFTSCDFISATSDTVFTENGIICVRLENSIDERKFFYVMGEDVFERSDAGLMGQGDETSFELERSINWIPGKWTSPLSVTKRDSYGMSSSEHVANTYAKHISKDLQGDTKNDLTYGSTVAEKIESVFYRYTYESHEILPVEELQSITFDVSVRMGSLQAYSPSSTPLQTKLVLYTMNETGNVTAYSWTEAAPWVNEANKTRHTAAIKSAFPDAIGWVVGFEIYPYGDLPEDVQFKVTDDESNIKITNFTVNFVPNAYTTVWENDVMKLSLQYNGANTSYIEGYADGTFRPDENITKAEVAALLSRLVLKSYTLPSGYYSSIPDVTVDAWYHDAVAFLEYNKAFSYLEGGKLYPDEHITRGELAQLIYNAAKFVKKTSVSNFSDLYSSHKHYPAISYLAEIGAINGYPDGTFRPDAKVSRAEAVTMINRLINLTANEKTVVKETLDNIFSDIEGHWAEYQILIASNDNVKTAAHLNNNNTSGLTEDNENIYIETDHVKVSISKDKGRVRNVINKENNENVASTTLSPWFASVTNSSGAYFEPLYAEIVDGRLHIVFSNDTEAYFLVETFDNYFTVKLDSELPHNVAYLDYAQISVNCAYSQTDADTYRISAVTMTTTTDSLNRPGASTQKTVGRVISKIGDVIGAKIGVTFSRYGGLKTGEHREYLKEICLAIDIHEGITSTKGGAFTYDEGNEELFYDYAILNNNSLTPNSAAAIGQVAKANSIEIIDLHQRINTFIQGDFNFVCARYSGETGFVPASTFKERIANVLNDEGVLLGLHTFSSLISPSASTILSVPKWQQQIEYKPEHILTLNVNEGNEVTATTTTLCVNESIEGRTFYPDGAGRTDVYSGYILVDEEIMLVTAYDTENGTLTVSRGQCGTTAAAHDANSEVRQLLSYFNCLQPILGSELYYQVAYNTGRACVEGGFDMIFLDGFESIENFGDKNLRTFYYAEFLRVILEAAYEASYEIYGDASKIPMIESSAFPVSFWAARGKAGSTDFPNRQYKKHIRDHLTSNKNHLRNYLTATTGWFNFYPGHDSTNINTYTKTLFRDDIDLLGVIGIAYDMSTALTPFSLSNFTHIYQLIDNYTYFNTYSRLREGGYFAEDVKEALKAGIDAGKEYKIFKQGNDTWAFREMKYVYNKVYDNTDNLFLTGNGTNPFIQQTPFIRIEQRYSTLSENEILVYAIDETKEVSSIKGTKTFSPKNLSAHYAIKVKVYGNGASDSGILFSFTSSSASEAGRTDYFVPTSHTGWREFILIDADNADTGLSGTDLKTAFTQGGTYRETPDRTKINSVNIVTAGDMTGVYVDDIRAYTLVDAPAKNPSVTIGGSTITFEAELNSGEYIEYYPEYGKAYYNYYDNDSVNGVNNQKFTEVISFTGSVTVPSGEFSYTYGAEESISGAPLRAKVTIGLTDYDNVIENPDSWEAPEVIEDLDKWEAPAIYMPVDNEKVKTREP